MQLYERTEMKSLHFIKDSMQLIGLILTGYHPYFLKLPSTLLLAKKFQCKIVFFSFFFS